MKKQARVWQKIFVMHKSEKWFISSMYFLKPYILIGERKQ